MLTLLFFVCIFSTAYSSDSNTVKQIAQDCKKETFHTTKKSPLDAALEKEIANLAKTNPKAYEKLVAYDKNKRAVEKKQ